MGYNMKNLTNMVDLAMTPMMDGVLTTPIEPKSPPPVVYPYGLAISLTQDEIEKLNVDHTDWAVGDHFCLDCLAKITSISEHENDGGKHTRVEMQIVAMSGEEDKEECEEEYEEDGDDEDGY